MWCVLRHMPSQTIAKYTNWKCGHGKEVYVDIKYITGFGKWIRHFGYWIRPLGYWIRPFGNWIRHFGTKIRHDWIGFKKLATHFWMNLFHCGELHLRSKAVIGADKMRSHVIDDLLNNIFKQYTTTDSTRNPPKKHLILVSYIHL